jgi:hypothetical protein
MIPMMGMFGGGSVRGFGKTRRSGYSGPPVDTAFNYTGSDQSFTVPANVTKLFVKLWGAGGGAGNTNSNSNAGGNGAGGGAVVFNGLDVTPGEVLNIRVGGSVSGVSASNGSTVHPSADFNSFGDNPVIYGGGGSAGRGDGAGANGAYGGAGGGASSIFRSSTRLITAYGGSGGGGAGYPAAVGQSAVSSAGSSAGGINITSFNGSRGGNGDGYGGGGGSGGSGSSANTGVGRAGQSGSSFVPIGALAYNGSGADPANTNDPNYPGNNVGRGGIGNNSGTSISGFNGHVWIRYGGDTVG